MLIRLSKGFGERRPMEANGRNSQQEEPEK
jgi:hypothetical protein